MNAQLKEILKSCIHCIIRRAGQRLSQLLATAQHVQHLNEVVHLDFLCAVESDTDNLKYVQTMKNDFILHIWLHSYSGADSDEATVAQSKRIFLFGTMECIVKTQGLPFTPSLAN